MLNSSTLCYTKMNEHFCTDHQLSVRIFLVGVHALVRGLERGSGYLYHRYHLQKKGDFNLRKNSFLRSKFPEIRSSSFSATPCFKQ